MSEFLQNHGEDNEPDKLVVPRQERQLFPNLPSNMDAHRIIGSAALELDSEDPTIMWQKPNGDFIDS